MTRDVSKNTFIITGLNKVLSLVILWPIFSGDFGGHYITQKAFWCPSLGQV